MDKSSTSLNSSTATNDINVRSKLRRLRIQEALILQSIRKLGGNNTNEDNFVANEAEINTSDYDNFTKNVKNSYINVKNLYDEVKTNTNTRELLADLDIEDMKKKVFELETNIKTLKAYIDTQLAALKLNEQELNGQINENIIQVQNKKIQRKNQTANYNAIVPSPVRVMMTSPFKSPEVQQFQEFMKNSQNRCGGWNEYNHNIFVKYWQKYFGKDFNSELEDGTIQKTLTFELFAEDVTPRLHGVTSIDIDSHVKWYAEYLYRKEQQQIAINKWKGIQTSGKKLTKKKQVQHAEEKNIPLETALDERDFIACHFNISRYDQPEVERIKKLPRVRSIESQRKQRPDLANRLMQPTKQWINRIQENVEQSVDYNSIEHTIQKLRTPVWRLGL